MFLYLAHEMTFKNVHADAFTPSKQINMFWLTALLHILTFTTWVCIFQQVYHGVWGALKCPAQSLWFGDGSILGIFFYDLKLLGTVHSIFVMFVCVVSVESNLWFLILHLERQRRLWLSACYGVFIVTVEKRGKMRNYLFPAKITFFILIMSQVFILQS